MCAIMLLFDAQQSQGFSDKSFDHLDSNSGIPDINSAPRRKVDGIGRSPPTVFSDRQDCPLTTEFPAGVGGRSDREACDESAPGRLSEPFWLVQRRIRTGLTPTQVGLRFLLEKNLTDAATCYMLRASAAQTLGAKGLMYEPTAVGRQPHNPHREIPRLEART